MDKNEKQNTVYIFSGDHQVTMAAVTQSMLEGFNSTSVAWPGEFWIQWLVLPFWKLSVKVSILCMQGPGY